MCAFNKKRKRFVRSMLVAAVGAVSSAGAYASGLPDLGVLAGFPEVPDHELATMRGRFVSRGRPVYFGLYMQSQWNDVSAGMSISFNLQKDLTSAPVAQVETTFSEYGAVGEPVLAAGANVTVDIGGLRTTEGVAQAVTVAGHANLARNDTDVVLHIGQPDTLVPDEPLVGLLETTTATSGSMTQSYEDGTVATALVSANELGLQIEAPGGGSAKQLVRSSNLANGTGLFQTIQIDGAHHSVNNLLGLTAIFEAIDNGAVVSNRSGFRQALQGLLGVAN